MRGEQRHARLISGRGAGSPPLARGTALHIVAKAAYAGITPACAGNRNVCRGNLTARRDHPRLRGEQPPHGDGADIQQGSPPLARGTAVKRPCVRVTCRITPACAGNSYPLLCVLKRHGDHPRLRGEQPHSKIPCKIQRGSPPLARGTVLETQREETQPGITPACAGNRKVIDNLPRVR